MSLPSIRHVHSTWLLPERKETYQVGRDGQIDEGRADMQIRCYRVEGRIVYVGRDGGEGGGKCCGQDDVLLLPVWESRVLLLLPEQRRFLI